MNRSSRPRVDFEILEDRLLFSGTPLGAVDGEVPEVSEETYVPEDGAGLTLVLEEGEPELLARFSEDVAEDESQSQEEVLPPGLLELGVEHTLVMEDWDAAQELIAEVLLDNEEFEEGEIDFIAANTKEIFDRLELLFVDTRITGFADLAEDLIANAAEGVELVLITFDPLRDGLSQVSEALGYYGTDDRSVEALHIFSHAMPGQMRIGGTSLTDHSFSQEAVIETLAGWKQFLSDDADILLYGCSLADGEAGVNFIQNLSDLTGADVAASTTAIGAEALGGNWTLELTVGSIETATLFSTLDIMLDATPQIWVTAPDNPFVNEPFEVSIEFENVGADVGYGPFVDLRVSDGASVVGGVDGFTYLGLPVTVLGAFSYDDLAALDIDHVPGAPIFVQHPLLQIGGTATGQLEHEIELAPGETYYVLELPFGSFASGQPGAVINFTAISERTNTQTDNFFPETAGVVGSVSFQVGGGFRYGEDALDNPNIDSPIYVSPLLNNEVGTA
ncbi:MAG: DUF4347 domain-containing protein, partial [Verrucomicrobiales bacterium]